MPKYTFDRYVNGQLRAMGIRIEKCESLSGAKKKAYRLNEQWNPEDRNVVLKLRKETPKPYGVSVKPPEE